MVVSTHTQHKQGCIFMLVQDENTLKSSTFIHVFMKVCGCPSARAASVGTALDD